MPRYSARHTLVEISLSYYVPRGRNDVLSPRPIGTLMLRSSDPGGGLACLVIDRRLLARPSTGKTDARTSLAADEPTDERSSFRRYARIPDHPFPYKGGGADKVSPRLSLRVDQKPPHLRRKRGSARLLSLERRCGAVCRRVRHAVPYLAGLMNGS